jgi:Holliday junction resolvase RusA-like endonuclease
MKILELVDVKLAKINQKFNVNRKTGALFANKEYTKFKNDVATCTLVPSNFDYKESFCLEIYVSTYSDIDASIKPILDGICMKLGMDDKYILNLHIYKKPIKKGYPETLRVFLRRKGYLMGDVNA